MPLLDYTLAQLAAIADGKLISGRAADSINQLLIDSRRIRATDGALFFAIKGERNDGHKYVNDLIKRGIRHFVVSDRGIEIEGDDANVGLLLVENSLDALQDIAAHHRSNFHYPVLGITGSNGKTIIKEWLYQLLVADVSIVRSPKSYNSQIGVPLSVWQMGTDHDLAIFEAGMSKPGEMRRLQRIIRPTLGLITNIGEAHSENFADLAEKTREKLRLFPGTETLFYCRDHAIIHKAIAEDAALVGTEKRCWSRKPGADLVIRSAIRLGRETRIEGEWEGEIMVVTIPFTDEASIENAVHCWLILLHLDIKPLVISKRLASLSPVAMRLEQKAGVNGCTVINDSYNSDINSLGIALDFLHQQNQHSKKTLILSDILQSGESEDELYKTVTSLVNRSGITRLIGIGKGIGNHASAFNIPQTEFYNQTSDFLAVFHPSAFRDEAVLLKGARKYGFEEVSQRLQQQAHETVMEINLSALVANYNYLRSRLHPDTKIMAMVKAFSYGSGSFEVANVLQFHHTDYLAVAYADEGVELRKAGITLPIMVMSPDPASFHSLIQYQLEPEIYSYHQLQAFSESLRKSMLVEHLPFPIHLKLDTGMHRLGFGEEDIASLAGVLQMDKHVKVASVFSHLVATDNADHDDFTRQQIKHFREMCAHLEQGLPYGFMKHILNSSGVHRFPEAQFDMVRIGIGLYGVASNADEQRHLELVSALKSTVTQLRRIKAGETVGYSRAGKVAEESVIATVSIGYADGYRRSLGNGKGKMLVNGHIAPTIGNVCMDMTMLNVTGIPVVEGDQVTVFGEGYPITEMARDMGTIPYEVLTGISRRVKRVYFQE